MQLFHGSQHQPFTFPATGQPSTGALLLHGFTGTPAEMRPLGSALVAEGISAYGPLLPGFGREFEELRRVTYQQWLESARLAWSTVRTQHERPVLIGFSLGAAIAIELAVDDPPHQLVLLAPFLKLAVPRAAFLLSVLRFIHRDFRPFEHEAADSPEIRDALLAIEPEADPDDPQTLAVFREAFVIPSASLLELSRMGQRAAKRAPRLTAPMLIVQGAQDNTVLPESTKTLVQRLQVTPRLIEVEGDHQLVRTNRPAWPQVRDAVVQFTREGT